LVLRARGSCLSSGRCSSWSEVAGRSGALLSLAAGSLRRTEGSSGKTSLQLVLY
jgi:hypothetical protein